LILLLPQQKSASGNEKCMLLHVVQTRLDRAVFSLPQQYALWAMKNARGCIVQARLNREQAASTVMSKKHLR